MALKKIKSRIWVNEYIIEFEYDTKRNNHKNQKRIIVTIDEDLVKRDFWLWVQINNEDKPHRAMLNVKILSIGKGEGYYINL